MLNLIDSHAHLAFPQFKDDLEETIERARQAGVRRIINIGAGLGLEGNQRAVSLAHNHPGIFATIGFHPHEANNWSPDILQKLLELARDEKVVAIGEIGLDYYKMHSPGPDQINAFRSQLELAGELEMPFVIHDREAHQDMMQILKENGAPFGAVMHCFSGSLEMAQELVRLGFYISIPGTVTFRNARVLPKVVKGIPLESLLLETDSPFLAPEPHRGQRNEPAYVLHVAKRVAEIKGIPIEDVARVTSANAENLFYLAPSE
jgi:TatD DNase family protein